MDIKGEIDSNTIIVGDFNDLLAAMDTSSRQKNNKEMSALIDTLNQMYLFNIFRAFHPKAAEYMFFSSAHETFSWIDHMLGHKTSLSKFSKIETLSSFFSDHNAMKLGINHKRTLKNRQRHRS